jgi:hypothetical protein
LTLSEAVFLNRWAVHIDGGPLDADRIAADHGFRNLGQVNSLINFSFHHNNH